MTQYYERTIAGQTERMLPVEGSPHCSVTSRFGRAPTGTTEGAPGQRSIGPSSNDHCGRPAGFVVDLDLHTAQRQCAQRYRSYVEDIHDEDDRAKIMSGD